MMKPVIRDLLASDIGSAVRLLEECRSLPDSKPADIAQHALLAGASIRIGTNLIPELIGHQKGQLRAGTLLGLVGPAIQLLH